MRHVRVQCEDQRRPVLDDSNPRVAMTMDSPLVAFGQAEPPLKIEIVPDRLELSRADEKAAQEAEHQRGHLVANRIVMPLESIDQLLELLWAVGATPSSRFEGRGDLLDVLDVLSDWLLLGPDVLQSPVNASGQSAELGFCESPFFDTPHGSPPDSHATRRDLWLAWACVSRRLPDFG